MRVIISGFPGLAADARREFERSAAGPIAERMAKVKDRSTETTDDLRPAIENQLQRQRARIGEKR